MNQIVVIPEWLKKRPPRTIPEPNWCTKARDKHWNEFLTQGLPKRSHESWKYTDLSLLSKQDFSRVKQADDQSIQQVIQSYRLKQNHILLVIVNGEYAAELTDQSKLPKGLIVCNLNEALKQHESLLKTHWPFHINAENYPFAALNAAVFNDGIFLHLPNDQELNIPIHILSLATQPEFIAHPHHVLLLGERSKAILLEEYVSLSDSAYMMNIVTNIVVGKEAKLDHYKIQKESHRAIHMAHTFINQAQNSNVTFTDFSYGGLFSRDDVAIKLNGPDALCRTCGFYRLQRDHQYIDHHIDIDHFAKRTTSEMLYKGILDKKSRAVFNGHLHVNENAQKILAYQANHNLLLSNDAEVYSKPELVICADDVKCKHGATIGQLDEDALFYLRSRGIDRKEAMNILIKGFAEEIIQRITHPDIKMRIREAYEH